MNEDGRWITINGAHVFLKEGQSPMDAFIKQKGRTKDTKETYFNKNFRLEDDDYYKEFNKSKKDYDYKQDKYWKEDKKGYDNEHGILEKRISVIDKKTNEDIGHIKYKEVYDFNKTSLTDKFNVDEIAVKEEYRGKGIATKLYRELQKRAGNQELHFGELTEEGKKLVESIGTITRKTNEKYPHYWGKIK